MDLLSPLEAFSFTKKSYKVKSLVTGMNREEILRIDGERFSVYLDPNGNLQRIVLLEKTFEPPLKCTLYEIGGETASVCQVPSNEKELSLRLTTKELSGILTISPGKEIKFHLEPDKKDVAEDVGLVLPFPLETEFHIPEGYNLGRRIDSEMAVGEWYSSGSYPLSRYTYISKYKELYRKGLGYNFFLANIKDMWIRFMTKGSRTKPDVHISRHTEAFIVTFTWEAADDAFINVFSSMDEAIKDYEAWLKNELGIKKLRDRPNVPEWVHNVKLVFIIDMMRPNWEIAHDYYDVINLATDLKTIGCAEDTLFYIPGWNGAYDSSYPTYKPHSQLGGEEKFREMVETLHKNGFRVMIHTNAWGLDPCHPNIDKYLKYVVKDEEGNYSGWQCNISQLKINRRTLKFLSKKIPLNGPKGAKSYIFETIRFPEMCESFITVGNLKVGDARVKLTIDRRSMLTPPKWFRDHEEYAFPFPFLFKTGRNKVHVEVIGEAEPDWSDGWYKIRYCSIPPTPYTSWTYPILHADTSNLEWIEIFVDNVESAVRKYNIDTVHVDATGYERHKQILDRLKQRLPNVPIAGEGFSSPEALGYWTFSQGARQSLTSYSDMMQGTRQQASLPDRSELDELYRWLDKPSPVCNFVKDYVKIYPHLCAADAFVLIGKVCNTFPPRLSPRSKEELRKILRDARRLNYIPGLRLNYRKYGVDEETRKAVQEIASWK